MPSLDSHTVAQSESARSTPLWLSHHHSTERCVQVGGRFICRRCLTLYPTVLLSMLLSAALLGGDVLATTPAIWALLAPMAIEWVLEHAGLIRYSPLRQTVVSIAAGLGGGLGLAAYSIDGPSLRATLPVIVLAAVCLLSSVLSGRTLGSTQKSEMAEGWLVRHELDEAARLEHLEQLLGLDHRSESVANEEPTPS